MSQVEYLDNKPLEREALEILKGIKDEFINTIPEKIFVSRYLPMLANKTGNTDLREWISIAGHVFNKVNVADETGKVIFSVPSVLKRPQTKQHKYAQQSVQEIVEMSKLHSRNSPKMGDRILTDGLKTTVDESFATDPDDEAAWAAILKRYNYVSPEEQTKVLDVLQKSKPVVEDNSDDGYEIA